MPMIRLLSVLFLGSLLCGCQRTCEDFEPHINYYPTACLLESRSSAFHGLSPAEGHTDWGKEMRTGYAFIAEQDYYRAISSFKRALVFLPVDHKAQKLQLQYGIVQAYYLGCKYDSAIEAFEASDLCFSQKDFPAHRDLLIMLYDCYVQDEREGKACEILAILQADFPEDADRISLSSAFGKADFPTILEVASRRPDAADFHSFIGEYSCLAKSENRAQLYQTLLPGAGYYYVGQKKAAVTSFLVNALFMWASYRFFERGYPAAGAITASLEAGWYFGGINGARLAAREYNLAVYETNGREFMRCRNLFPILMINTSF